VKRALLWFDVATTLVLVALAFRYGPRTGYFYSGLGLTAVAMPFWILARLQLGRSFSVTARARQLVTRGLYSKLRNPIYFFGGLAYFGALVALQVWPVLLGWLALTPIQILRIRREEKVLAEAFGAEYEAYRARTWF
jgi:protein-S-isoprenylcysteine O-methyltransferase Ste14